MDQIRSIPGAAPAPPPKRLWRRFRFEVQQVENPPAKIFSIDRGPYTFRVDVAMTAQLMRRLGVALTALIALSHPVLWKAILFVAQVLASVQ